MLYLLENFLQIYHCFSPFSCIGSLWGTLSPCVVVIFSCTSVSIASIISSSPSFSPRDWQRNHPSDSVFQDPLLFGFCSVLFILLFRFHIQGKSHCPLSPLTFLGKFVFWYFNLLNCTSHFAPWLHQLVVYVYHPITHSALCASLYIVLLFLLSPVVSAVLTEATGFCLSLFLLECVFIVWPVHDSLSCLGMPRKHCLGNQVLTFCLFPSIRVVQVEASSSSSHLPSLWPSALLPGRHPFYHTDFQMSSWILVYDCLRGAQTPSWPAFSPSPRILWNRLFCDITDIFVNKWGKSQWMHEQHSLFLLSGIEGFPGL